VKLRKLAAVVNRADCVAIATKVETAITTFRAALSKVAETIQIDSKTLFSATSTEGAGIRLLAHTLERWATAVSVFNDWAAADEGFAALNHLGMPFISEGLKGGDIGASEIKPVVELLIAEALWRAAIADDPALEQIDGNRRSETVTDFRALDRRRIELARSEVLARYFERKPTGVAGEMAVVRAEIGKKRRHLPVRKLMESAGFAIQRLKPIFLMSPLSVAQFLPPAHFAFDLVVIDEASQVPPEEALGAIARARQMVVVGDDKQLPPTNFFRMLSADDDDDDGTTTVAVSPARPRNFESILTLARARGTPERMLRWHYRSKHPSLIAMSNHSCYAGGLLLPPSPLIKSDEFGLSLVKTPPGHYERGGSGRNPVEADVIAAAIEQHIVNHPDRSLGVACFSVAQRDAIEDALQARGLLAAAEQFSPNGERLFIKNLEAVQGDERDVIFISIGYGFDAQGRMTAGFGPLSADGGERRLNVLISRARLQCVVFSSIGAGDIPTDVRARGTKMLREFLHFAETGHVAAGEVAAVDFDSPFEEAVAISIRRAGHDFRPQVGVAGFRIDLGILDPKRPGRFVLGVECDGAAYHSGRSARDRDRLRQEVLEGLGWKLYRIWSTDWFRNPERESEKLLSAIECACAASTGTGAPRADTKPTRQRVNQMEVPAAASESEGVGSNDTPGAIPYRECALRVPRGAELLRYDHGALSELAVTVVREEGPIHVEEIARRIREAFGLERTGRKILSSVGAALKRAARSGALKQVGKFWVANGVHLSAPRSRRNASIPLRRPDRIAPMEYQLAIKTVLQSCVAATKSELTVGVARLFGFDRTGNGVDQAISDEIEFMIEGSALNDTGGRITLLAETCGQQT
jgi:very-short-patch-repair endonuclease